MQINVNVINSLLLVLINADYSLSFMMFRNKNIWVARLSTMAAMACDFYGILGMKSKSCYIVYIC